MQVWQHKDAKLVTTERRWNYLVSEELENFCHIKIYSFLAIDATLALVALISFNFALILYVSERIF